MRQRLCDHCEEIMTAEDIAFIGRPHRFILKGGPVVVRFTPTTEGDACRACLVAGVSDLATPETAIAGAS